MLDPIAKTSLSDLANAFETFVRDYPVLDIGRRVHAVVPGRFRFYVSG
jgi:hypothetical protein